MKSPSHEVTSIYRSIFDLIWFDLLFRLYAIGSSCSSLQEYKNETCTQTYGTKQDINTHEYKTTTKPQNKLATDKETDKYENEVKLI